MKKLWILFVILGISQIYCLDRLTITNNTPQEIFVAFYYSIGGSAMKRASGIFAIQSHKERVIPVSQDLPDVFTRFAVGATQHELKEYVYPARMLGVTSRYFDSQIDTGYVVTKKNDLFFMYNQDEWQQIKTILGITEPTKYGLLRNKIKRDFAAFKNNPYKFSVAHVRQGNALSKGERKAVAQRLQKVRVALENKFKTSISYVPKISLVTSGGGYRSMLMTLGFLAAAEEIGLKDMITWWTTCSGSGWGAAAYYMHKLEYKNSFGQPYTIQEFRRDFFSEIADKGLKPSLFKSSDGQIRLMRNALAVNWAAHQPITLVDLYGLLLANHVLSFFGENRHRQYLSSLALMVEQGDIIPLWSVIDSSTESIWYEFSPWEFGSSQDACYIPVWSLGRKFNEGHSEDFSPEKSLDFLLGVTGSAFAIRFKDIYKDLLYRKKADGLKGKMMRQIVQGKTGFKRVSYGEVANYMKGLTDIKNKDFSTDPRFLTLIDAGLAGNLPYPLLGGERSERASDILIFLDNSFLLLYKPEAPRIHALKYAEEYAEKHGLKFPKISYDQIGREPISIFKDEHDAQVPVVIYIPGINYKNFWSELSKPEYRYLEKYVRDFDIIESVRRGFAHTHNFTFRYEQAMQLSYISEFTLKMVQDKIFEEIKNVIFVKNNAYNKK